MDTTDHVVLIILAVLLSIFFTMLIAAAVLILKLVTAAKGIVHRAEEVLASVESATDTAANVFKQTSNRKAAFSLMKTIYKLSQKGKK